MMIMIRILIVVLLVVVGAAALSDLNPAAEQSVNPIVKGLATIQSWFRSNPLPTTAGNKENETVVYKWKDTSGEWHFSNQPPPEGTASSVKIYRSDTNVTQAPASTSPPSIPATQTPPIPQTPAPLLPITDPQRVKQLVEDAKNVQGLMDKRQQTLEQHSGQ
ncbi:MAG TPA: DUF4124 domain-containing protein [Gammaproteobacteria bacterium]|nr:DUF4124 domain-containing protein [Gammaproteobacteria bacterium]